MAAIPDHYLARLQLAAYQYPDASGKPTVFPWTWKAEIKHPLLGTTITAGFVRLPTGEQVVILPGTGGEADVAETIKQWMLNLYAIPSPTSHPQFGIIDAGFYFDIEAFVTSLTPQIDPAQPIYVIGHSRGAVQAAFVAGLLKLSGVKVERLCCFESPKGVGATFAAFISDIPALGTRMVNVDHTGFPTDDMVTDLPPTLITEPAVPPAAVTEYRATPMPFDVWGAFALHHMQLVASVLGESA